MKHPLLLALSLSLSLLGCSTQITPAVPDPAPYTTLKTSTGVTIKPADWSEKSESIIPKPSKGLLVRFN